MNSEKVLKETEKKYVLIVDLDTFLTLRGYGIQELKITPEKMSIEIIKIRG